MWAARSLFCSSGFAHVEQPAIGRQLFLCLQGRELWPSDKKAGPSSSPLTLFHSVSTLVFCVLAWPAPNRCASSDICQAPCRAYCNSLYCRTEQGPHPLVIVDSTKQVGWQTSSRSNQTSVFSEWVCFWESHVAQSTEGRLAFNFRGTGLFQIVFLNERTRTSSTSMKKCDNHFHLIK